MYALVLAFFLVAMFAKAFSDVFLSYWIKLGDGELSSVAWYGIADIFSKHM